MKPIIPLFVIFVFCWSSANCSCSHWKKRMEKYGALANCEYYETSESECQDYFAFDKIAKKIDNNTIQIRFFTLTQGALKFVLSDKNNTNKFDDNFHKVRRRRALTTFGKASASYTTPSYTHTENPLDILFSISEIYYEFVFDAVNDGGYTKTYVTKGSKRLKTLSRPEVVRKHEPNEVLVEIFSDGKIRTTINENDTLEIRGSNVNALNFISFLAPRDRFWTEFFYNCRN